MASCHRHDAILSPRPRPRFAEGPPPHSQPYSIKLSQSSCIHFPRQPNLDLGNTYEPIKHWNPCNYVSQYRHWIGGECFMGSPRIESITKKPTSVKHYIKVKISHHNTKPFDSINWRRNAYGTTGAIERSRYDVTANQPRACWRIVSRYDVTVNQPRACPASLLCKSTNGDRARAGPAP